MASIHVSAAYSSRCYRLTPKGRACVEFVETTDQTIGSLSRYLRDVLIMCGSAAWLEQLRQSMPPRTLEQSLRALLTLELIECLYSQEPSRNARALSVFGACA